MPLIISTMSRDSLENLNDRLVSLGPLLKILECPVCLEVVKIPFKQCQRGHLVCSDCIETLPNCPSCEAAFSFESPVCMKTLIESLPRPCVYVGAGCKEVTEPNSDHQIYCGFRPVKCRRCKEQTPVCQLKQHLIEAHTNPLHTNLSSQLMMQILNSDFTYNCSICVDGYLFWLAVRSILNGIVKIKWQAYFVGKPKKDYYITLTFEKDNIGSKITLKASDLSNASEKEEENCCTYVCFSSLKRCINTEGDLVIVYEVFSKPKTS